MSSAKRVSFFGVLEAMSTVSGQFSGRFAFFLFLFYRVFAFALFFPIFLGVLRPCSYVFRAVGASDSCFRAWGHGS